MLHAWGSWSDATQLWACGQAKVALTDWHGVWFM